MNLMEAISKQEKHLGFCRRIAEPIYPCLAVSGGSWHLPRPGQVTEADSGNPPQQNRKHLPGAIMRMDSPEQGWPCCEIGGFP